MASKIDRLKLPAETITHTHVRFKVKEDQNSKVIYQRSYSGAMIAKGIRCFKKKLFKELIQQQDARNDPYPDNFLSEQDEIYIALDPVDHDEMQVIATNPHSLFHDAMTAAMRHSNLENLDKSSTARGLRKRREKT